MHSPFDIYRNEALGMIDDLEAADDTIARLKAESQRLRERAERAERERDAILKWARRYCPECEGDGLRIAGTFVSDEGVCEGHEERCDCDAAIRRAAGLDAAPAGEGRTDGDA